MTDHRRSDDFDRKCAGTIIAVSVALVVLFGLMALTGAI